MSQIYSSLSDGNLNDKEQNMSQMDLCHLTEMKVVQILMYQQIFLLALIVNGKYCIALINLLKISCYSFISYHWFLSSQLADTSWNPFFPGASGGLEYPVCLHHKVLQGCKTRYAFSFFLSRSSRFLVFFPPRIYFIVLVLIITPPSLSNHERGN